MTNPPNDQPPPSTGPSAPGGSPPAPTTDPELTAPRECPDCRPRVLDSIRCWAEGVKAEAQYVEDHKDGPSPDKYEAARLAYGTARHAATTVVAKVRGQLTHVTDQLRCLIDDSETVERLDDAWLDVKERLEACEPRLGCCVADDDDFDTNVSDDRTEMVKARKAEYEHRTEAAEECFTQLLGEPSALTDRVADLQAEAAGIASDVDGDPATTDFKRLYARALVAQRHLDEVWWGFDYAHDYVDCLCRALRISLRGRAALSKLTGELTVRTCRKTAREDRCKHLRDNMADGIIEEYVRRELPRHPHDDDHEHRRRPDDDREDREQDEDSDRDRYRRRDDRDRDDRDRDDDRRRHRHDDQERDERGRYRRRHRDDRDRDDRDWERDQD
jgi:hypothetical protein